LLRSGSAITLNNNYTLFKEN